MARRVPRGQETRERILGAALGLFAAEGYASVSVEQIADAAGVTKGAVYHWFADKDDLGRELQRDLYQRLALTSMHTFVADDDIVSNMARAFEAYLAALGDSGEARFFLRDAWVIPALDDAGRADEEAAIEMIGGIVAAAIERGELVALDPAALTRVLTGMFVEATLHVLRTGERAATDAVVRHFLESLRVPARAAAVAGRR